MNCAWLSVLWVCALKFSQWACMAIIRIYWQPLYVSLVTYHRACLCMCLIYMCFYQVISTRNKVHHRSTQHSLPICYHGGHSPKVFTHALTIKLTAPQLLATWLESCRYVLSLIYCRYVLLIYFLLLETVRKWHVLKVALNDANWLYRSSNLNHLCIRLCFSVVFVHVLYCMLIAPAENVCPLMEAVSTAIVSTK